MTSRKTKYYDDVAKDVRANLGYVEPDPKTCASCAAWKPKPNQHPTIFGGCARGGKTTLHYGDVAYSHYTTDLQSCSAWEPK